MKWCDHPVPTGFSSPTLYSLQGPDVLRFRDTSHGKTAAYFSLPVQAEVATLELALANADAEAAAIRERLAVAPTPAAKVRVATQLFCPA